MNGVIKNRGILLSLLVVIILGGIVGFNRYHSNKPEKVEAYFGDISSFCIKAVCLEQKDNQWLVVDNGKAQRADKELAEVYLKNIKELKTGELISENKDRFRELGVDIENPIILSAGGKKLILGNVSSDYSGTYVMKDGEEKVYKTAAVLESDNLEKSDYWRLKQLTNTPVNRISKLIIKQGEKSREIVAKDGNWPNQKQIEAAAALKVTRMLEVDPQKVQLIEIRIESDDEEQIIWAGRVEVGRNKWQYVATDDNKWFHEIKQGDYALLTGQKK